MSDYNVPKGILELINDTPIEEDTMYEDARYVVLKTQSPTVATLQKYLSIDKVSSYRLLKQLTDNLILAYDGSEYEIIIASGPTKMYITKYEESRKKQPEPKQKTQAEIDLEEYGTLTCYYCGKTKCAKGGVTRSINVETGSSSGSYTYSGSIGGGLWSSSTTKRKGSRVSARVGRSYNTGRTYYKRKEIDVCALCNELGKVDSTWLNWILIIQYLAIVPTTIYGFLLGLDGNLHPVNWNGFDWWVLGTVLFVGQIVLLKIMEHINDSWIEEIKNDIRKKHA